MILETTIRPRTAFQKLDLPQNQLPKLWPQLETDVQRQLAFSWAQLIAHVREEQDVEIRHDYGRYR
jgi:hypothetical protein